MARISFIALAFALLIGLSPLSNHMLSMPEMKMDAMAASNGSNVAHESSGEHSASTCCDAITPCALVVDLLFPQFADMALYRDSERFARSALTVQPIYIKILSPPPKA